MPLQMSVSLWRARAAFALVSQAQKGARLVEVKCPRQRLACLRLCFLELEHRMAARLDREKHSDGEKKRVNKSKMDLTVDTEGATKNMKRA